jgi:putative spermidine/putrescine transport system substrate-binding protein
MKKKTITAALFGLLAAGLTQVTLAEDLTVISFGGANQEAQVKAYYEPFQKATGITLIPVAYNGEMAKIKAMVEAGKPTWDVVEVESPELLRGCEEGLFETLDFSKIGNKDDFLASSVTDCGIGIFVWSVVLAYNADLVKGTPPSSWADFWDVEQYPGKRGLRKGAKYTLEIALLADGVAPAEVYQVLGTKEGVERAFKKLDEIKPHIQWWEAGAQPPQMLASGDLVMSSAYNGRIDAAQKEGKNLKIVWAGNIYDVDSWAIPTGAPKMEQALQFIAFASQPENQKVYSESIAYGPTNIKAVSLIDPKMAETLPTAPANLEGAVAIDIPFWVDHGEELEQRFNTWAAAN